MATQNKNKCKHTCGQLVMLAGLAIGLTPMAALAAGDSQFYTDIAGWEITSYTSSESSPNPSCSAVHFIDHVTAIRVERLDEGHIYGFNGLNRDQEGPTYPVTFWFDQQIQQSLSGDAGFIFDAAYPYDDWLSFFHPIGETPSPIDAISGMNSINFSFRMAGNRTGNDEVILTFPLSDGESVMRTLEECYRAAIGPQLPNQPTTRSSAQSAPAQTRQSAPAPGGQGAPSRNANQGGACADGIPRLPETGLCQDEAARLIPQFGNLYLGPSCTTQINETAFAGDYLIYSALSCNGTTTKLGYAGGAKFANLDLITSAAYSEYDVSNRTLVTIGSISNNDPAQSILYYVQDMMGPQDNYADCFVQSGRDYGFPTDSYVVNIDKATSDAMSNEGPGSGPAECGEWGYFSDATSFWRAFAGFSWYFSFGQDAIDFDAQSLTLITTDGNGGWEVVR